MGYKKRTVSKTGEITDEIPESVPETEGTARLARAEGVPEPEPEIPEPEPEIEPSQSGSSSGTNTEDAAAIRKQEIADKRRASLALARSKIVPKSALKKQAEEVIKGKDAQLKNKQEETDAMRLKYEKDRVKQLEDSLLTLQKLVAERPTPIAAEPFGAARLARAEPVAPVAEVKPKYKRPSRAKPSQSVVAETKQPQQIIPKKSVEPRMVAPPSTETLIDKSYGEQLQERLRSQAVNKIMMDTFGGF
jgi:hypothetical protein